MNVVHMNVVDSENTFCCCGAESTWVIPTALQVFDMVLA